MTEPQSPLEIAESLTEYWSPKVIAEVDDHYVKVAKVKGQLAWHEHAGEDEMFQVLRGHLKIELPDRSVELGAGELFVVPRGVRHNPIAERETLIMLFERKQTRHTGDVTMEKTRSIAQQLR
ncbi:MAG: cupin domain-containing protein [Wenzhouxiangellaceae bacterium]|nr:cupin domain-containing protein [Wenzhouxiangellaceae bacterium]